MLQTFHLPRFRLKFSKEILAPRFRNLRVLFCLLLSGGVGFRLHGDGAERLNLVGRPISHSHAHGFHLAAPLAGLIGNELKLSGRVGLDHLDFAPAGPHLNFDGLAVENAGLGKLATGHRKWFRNYGGVAHAQHSLQHALVVQSFEIHADHVAGHGGFRAFRGCYQACVILAAHAFGLALIVVRHV